MKKIHIIIIDQKSHDSVVYFEKSWKKLLKCH